jgi:hypothetical protein
MVTSGGWPKTSAESRSPASLRLTSMTFGWLRTGLPSTITSIAGISSLPGASGTISTA